MSTPPVILRVPTPPSANRLWRVVPGRKKPMLDVDYRMWRDTAGWQAKIALAGGVPPIECRFDVYIEVPRSRVDLDNRLKPLLDLCQHVGIITNDANANAISMTATDRADCMIALTPRPELPGVRAPAKKRGGKPGYVSKKPSAKQLARVAAVRARIPF